MVYRSTPENRPKDPHNLTPAAASSNQPIGLKFRYYMVHAWDPTHSLQTPILSVLVTLDTSRSHDDAGRFAIGPKP